MKRFYLKLVLWLFFMMVAIRHTILFFMAQDSNQMWTKIKDFWWNVDRPKKSTGRREQLQILVWLTPRAKGFMAIPSEGSITSTTCPYECTFTHDKDRVNDSDAIAFIGIVAEDKRDGPSTTTTPSKLFIKDDKKKPKFEGQMPPFPPKAVKSQIRVFVLIESPHMFGPHRPLLPNDYNWTMTYRTDSDIPYPYGQVELKPNSSPISQSHIEALKKHTLAVPTRQKWPIYKNRYWDNKSRLIAWASSHKKCKTSSNREDLIAQLQKLVPIDTYGSCGTLNCPQKREGNWYDCYRVLGQKYKFYLAFENSICTDYVTEKFFLPLKHQMIPIVYGGANYDVVGPPGSYIDVRDFPTIQALADHIKFLDKNPGEYFKYFYWTEHYQVTMGMNGWCALCAQLQKHSKKVIIRTDNGEGKREEQKILKRVVDPNYLKIYKNISYWLYHKPKGQSRRAGSSLFTCLEGGLMRDGKFNPNLY